MCDLNPRTKTTEKSIGNSYFDESRDYIIISNEFIFCFRYFLTETPLLNLGSL